MPPQLGSATSGGGDLATGLQPEVPWPLTLHCHPAQAADGLEDPVPPEMVLFAASFHQPGSIPRVRDAPQASLVSSPIQTDRAGSLAGLNGSSPPLQNPSIEGENDLQIVLGHCCHVTIAHSLPWAPPFLGKQLLSAGVQPSGPGPQVLSGEFPAEGRNALLPFVCGFASFQPKSAAGLAKRSPQNVPE